MAVKKKVVAKKAVAKKAVAKKTAKKAVTKKAVAKKAVAKKTAKKAVAKKAVAKKAVAKKASVKKSTTKKAAVKRVAKKASVKPTVSGITRLEIAAPLVTPPAPKPVAAPSQNTSGRVVFLVIAGIVILGAIVWSKSSGKDEVSSPTPTPSISQSAEPTQSAAVIASVESPTKFVAIKSGDGLKLRWVGPTVTEGLTGYNVEIRANGVGDWTVIATVPVDQLTQDVVKSSDSGWTQFRVSSVYSDGQVASATVFGIPGEFM